MDINPVEIKSKTQIGSLDGKSVWELALKGGLSVIARIAKSGVEILSAAPHRAIGRFMAKKKFPKLELITLEKSEYPPAAFQHLIPEYEAITDRLNALKK